MKMVYLLILGGVFAYGENNYELKLYEKVLPMLFEKIPLRVYADSEVSELLRKSPHFQLLSECNDSVTVLIGRSFTDLPEICRNKPIFATSYQSFITNANTLGAFYWRKGRPQLRFKKEVLERYGINIPKKLMRYMEE